MTQLELINGLRYQPGSIGDTARQYADAYNRFNKLPVRNSADFEMAFHSVIVFRLFEMGHKATLQENLMRHDNLFAIYKTFDSIVPSTLSYSYKIDLPSMVLYAIVLESKNVRLAINADPELRRMVIQIVFEEVSKVSFHQTISNIEDFKENNVLILTIYSFNCFIVDSVKGKLTGTNFNH